jgi:hypothetical protein
VYDLLCISNVISLNLYSDIEKLKVFSLSFQKVGYKETLFPPFVFWTCPLISFHICLQHSLFVNFQFLLYFSLSDFSVLSLDLIWVPYDYYIGCFRNIQTWLRMCSSIPVPVINCGIEIRSCKNVVQLNSTSICTTVLKYCYNNNNNNNTNG